jgi:hypothetical protein
MLQRTHGYALLVVSAVLAGVLFSGSTLWQTGMAQTESTVEPVAIEASPTAAPKAPQPGECSFAPRPIEEILATVHTIYAGEATFTPPDPQIWSANNEYDVAIAGTPWIDNGDAAVPLTAGTQVDDRTIAGINATLRMWAACFNAGDLLRELSLYTESGLVLKLYGVNERQGEEAGDPPSESSWRPLLESTPMSLPPDRWALPDVLVDARFLPDGTVFAVARSGGSVNDPPSSTVTPWIMLFEEVAGVWLIDFEFPNLNSYDLSPSFEAATPVAVGTPVPVATP